MDPRCQEILESIREQESLQAVDRLRLIHAAKQKTVYLLSNLPLPSLPPDELAALDDLLLPGRLAEVMLRDFALVGPAALATRHPDLFSTAKAAEREYRTFAEAANTAIPYKNSIRETRGLLSVITYRTKGTSGKPRRALAYASMPADMVCSLLSNIHNAPIPLLIDRKPLVAPAKPPVSAVAPEIMREEPPAPPPDDRKPPEFPPIIPDEPLYMPTLPGPLGPSIYAMPPHLTVLYAGLNASAAARSGIAA